MNGDTPATALGLDFGTTPTVVALADGRGSSELVEFGAIGEVVLVEHSGAILSHRAAPARTWVSTKAWPSKWAATLFVCTGVSFE